MTRRSGMSLTEVLVALFLMALGTISILTLFPIGALQMGQALKDDRTAQAAMQADAFMRTYWKLNVVEKEYTYDSFPGAFLDPSQGGFPPSPPNPAVASPQPNLLPVTASAGNPSYPIVIDPMGFVSRSGAGRVWVVNQNPAGAIQGTNLARRNLSPKDASMGSTQALRTCSLMDGLGYAPNGAASTTGGTVDRESRYNWLWVLQQSDTSNQTSADMTVVLFDKRAPLFAPATAETILPVTSCQPGSATLQVSLGGAPQVQKGSWLLDATVVNLDYKGVPYVPPNPPPNPTPAPPPPNPQPISFMRNANFYRVVSVTDNPGNGTTDIELQTPMVPDTVTPNPPITPAFSVLPANLRQFVVLAGVSEVFQRPPLSSGP